MCLVTASSEIAFAPTRIATGLLCCGGSCSSLQARTAAASVKEHPTSRQMRITKIMLRVYKRCLKVAHFQDLGRSAASRPWHCVQGRAWRKRPRLPAARGCSPSRHLRVESRATPIHTPARCIRPRTDRVVAVPLTECPAQHCNRVFEALFLQVLFMRRSLLKLELFAWGKRHELDRIPFASSRSHRYCSFSERLCYTSQVVIQRGRRLGAREGEVHARVRRTSHDLLRGVVAPQLRCCAIGLLSSTRHYPLNPAVLDVSVSCTMRFVLSSKSSLREAWRLKDLLKELRQERVVSDDIVHFVCAHSRMSSPNISLPARCRDGDPSTPGFELEPPLSDKQTDRPVLVLCSLGLASLADGGGPGGACPRVFLPWAMQPSRSPGQYGGADRFECLIAEPPTMAWASSDLVIGCPRTCATRPFRSSVSLLFALQPAPRTPYRQTHPHLVETPALRQVVISPKHELNRGLSMIRGRTRTR